MGEFVHVYNDGGGIRDVSVPPSSSNLLGNRGLVAGYGPVAIATIGTPFVILPGDGAAIGMFFTGTAGAFTLPVAILPNAWNALKGCWCYLPANFGGKTYPAGWYWAVFSSDTAGILYMDTYKSGIPLRPSTPTPFPVNLSGWLTTTTSEITGPTGLTLRGGSMGPSGVIKSHIRTMGSASGTKTFRQYLDSTLLVFSEATTNPNGEQLILTANQGSESLQVNSASSDNPGVGRSTSTFTATNYSAVDTSADRTLSYSLQISAAWVCAILLHADVTVTYGA